MKRCWVWWYTGGTASQNACSSQTASSLYYFGIKLIFKASITQKNLPVRKQSTQQPAGHCWCQHPAHSVSEPTGTHARLGWGSSPQNTCGGRFPAYSGLRATNLISFQTGNLWLTDRHLFLGMASSSSRWKRNRLWPPAITATFTAQILTGSPQSFGQCNSGTDYYHAVLQLCITTCGPPITQVILNFARSALALHFFPLPVPSQTSWEPFPNHPVTSTVSSSTDCLIHSESATSDEPQLAWS